MPFVKRRPDLVLSETDRAYLDAIRVRRVEPHGRVIRAEILCAYSDHETVSSIARRLGISRPRVERCIDKALAGGVETALRDLPGRGRKPTITKEAKLWVVNLACTKPTEHGYASETWTYAELAKHVRQHAVSSGHACLASASKSVIHGILKEHPVQPHKISYYLERRDPDFEAKQAQVLICYKEVERTLEQPESERPQVVTLSVDEKPGVQAIGNVAEELPPQPGKHPTRSRDHQYKRHGTLSLIAAIDLLTGHILGIVRPRHRSREFIELLKKLHAHYPRDWKIRLILDNHSSHKSKETRQFLTTLPNRFELVFTPTHGSWLNLIETFFSKMSRSFLRHIRVESRDELERRVLQYWDELNAEPVVFRWRYKMDQIVLPTTTTECA